MRVRSLFVTMLGMAVAGGSVFLSQEFLQVQPATASLDQNPGTVSVVVAGQDIPFGTTIEAHKLTTIQWPAEAVPVGVYTSYDDLIGGVGVEPRRAKRAMAQGELLIAAKVSDFGEKVTIVQTLAKGKRAVAIRVNAETSVGGFVTPGDKVDIMLTTAGGEGGLRTITILQDMRIVAVDQQADELNEETQIARTVTVEVTPQEAQKLSLAQRAGELSLTLRSLTNDEDAPIDSIRLSDIIREKSPDDNHGPKYVVKVRRATGNVEEIELEKLKLPQIEEAEVILDDENAKTTETN